ncbi:hypothetical protein OEZ85_000867 [Tetradesmus obliquus]|uniref:AP2/ERF domain-containing protein n=1 Tax=Tetradesmus obliquus TaxID=3088 RepID=A0ABY8UJP3_TETOB|nr:hypothetical protein OEZ85_000867 [Tetradesmus obliquus]
MARQQQQQQATLQLAVRRSQHMKVYIGSYELEDTAAEAFDMVALKCRGAGAATNFPAERYAGLAGSMGSMSLEEVIMEARRLVCLGFQLFIQGFNGLGFGFQGSAHCPAWA